MNTKLIKLLSIILAVLIVACSGVKARRGSFSLSSPLPSPREEEQALSRSPTPDSSSIRSVDFDNVSYHNLPDFGGVNEKRITLKPGEGRPSHINYGDATGDGQEEAFVVLPIDTRGSAIQYHVYVFTIEKQRPKLLWDFDTGDRADGGLRQIYADNGHLVVELYGKDRVVNGDLYKGDESLCCPDSFTRTLYKWDIKEFKQIDRQVLINPKGDANLLMPRFDSSK
jgi:hypothetical protein